MQFAIISVFLRYCECNVKRKLAQREKENNPELWHRYSHSDLLFLKNHPIKHWRINETIWLNLLHKVVKYTSDQLL